MIGVTKTKLVGVKIDGKRWFLSQVCFLRWENMGDFMFEIIIPTRIINNEC